MYGLVTTRIFVIRYKTGFWLFLWSDLGAEDDSWSLGSAGTMADSDSADVRTLKEKLIKLKQSEGILKDQLEVLQSTLQIMGTSNRML